MDTAATDTTDISCKEIIMELGITQEALKKYSDSDESDLVFKVSSGHSVRRKEAMFFTYYFHLWG